MSVVWLTRRRCEQPRYSTMGGLSRDGGSAWGQGALPWGREVRPDPVRHCDRSAGVESYDLDKRRWTKHYIQNGIAFCIFGVTNNFAYVVMLSAAHDILKQEEDGGGGNSNSTENITTTVSPFITTDTTGYNLTTVEPSNEYMKCNTLSTGAILLADILPTLCIKSVAPFFIQRISYRVKVILVIFFGLASFLMVALAHEVWLSFLGVVSASCGAGLGEITFLSLTAFYDASMVSFWSTGTGLAGVAGSLGYAGLTMVMTPRVTVLIMLVVPALMGVGYFFILGSFEIQQIIIPNPDMESGSTTTLVIKEEERKQTSCLSLATKLKLVVPLLRYMIPLTVVYYAEYFINQGLHELLYFNDFWDMSVQYRWYQVSYQFGVLISRTLGSHFPLVSTLLWIPAVLQLGNLVLLVCQVYYRFVPSFWVLFVIIIWEGLLGGLAYVKTFYSIRKEIDPQVVEFSLGVASLGDTVGIAVAGATAIPVHNYICTQRIRM